MNNTHGSQGIKVKDKNEGLLKDSIIMFAATSGVNLLNFIFHMYVSRKLGPEEYGVLVPLLGLVILFSMPALALQMTIVKKTSICMARENYGGIEHLFRKTTGWFLMLGAVYFIGFLAGGPFIQSFFKIDDYGLIVILGLIAVVSLIIPVVRGILQGMQNFIGFGLNLTLDAILRLGSLILFLMLGFGVRGALLTTFVGAFCAYIIGIFMLSFLFKNREKSTEIIRKRDILSYALPVFFSATAFSLLSYIDVFMVKHFFAEHDAGLYSATSIIGKAFLFFPGAIVMTLFPKVSQSFELNNATGKMLLKSLGLTAVVSAAAIIFCYFFPDFVIGLLFGAEYKGIAPVVKIFGAAILPLVLINVVMNYCLAIHRYAMIYIMYAGIILYAVLLWFFHASFMQVITILFSVNLAILLLSLITAKENRKPEHAV